jgi:hypothetical protein
MLVGISGDINSGKDVVGRMFQYLTSEYQNKYSFENWLDRVDKYKSILTALLKSSLLINSKTWYVYYSVVQEKSWKTGNSRTLH